MSELCFCFLSRLGDDRSAVLLFRLSFPQTKKLPRQSGFGGQRQADQIRRAIVGLDGDRGRGSDAREKQQGCEQMYRGSLIR